MWFTKLASLWLCSLFLQARALDSPTATKASDATSAIDTPVGRQGVEPVELFTPYNYQDYRTLTPPLSTTPSSAKKTTLQSAKGTTLPSAKGTTLPSAKETTLPSAKKTTMPSAKNGSATPSTTPLAFPTFPTTLAAFLPVTVPPVTTTVQAASATVPMPVYNSPRVQWNVTQVQNETTVEMAHHDHIKHYNKITLAVINSLGLGLLGLDRCCMGQCMFGVLKCVTVGGCLLWWIADSFVIWFNCVTRSDEIDVLGFRAKFFHHDVTVAFWISITVILLHIATMVLFKFYQGRLLHDYDRVPTMNEDSVASSAGVGITPPGPQFNAQQQPSPGMQQSEQMQPSGQFQRAPPPKAAEAFPRPKAAPVPKQSQPSTEAGMVRPPQTTIPKQQPPPQSTTNQPPPQRFNQGAALTDDMKRRIDDQLAKAAQNKPFAQARDDVLQELGARTGGTELQVLARQYLMSKASITPQTQPQQPPPAKANVGVTSPSSIQPPPTAAAKDARAVGQNQPQQTAPAREPAKAEAAGSAPKVELQPLPKASPEETPKRIEPVADKTIVYGMPLDPVKTEEPAAPMVEKAPCSRLAEISGSFADAARHLVERNPVASAGLALAATEVLVSQDEKADAKRLSAMVQGIANCAMAASACKHAAAVHFAKTAAAIAQESAAAALMDQATLSQSSSKVQCKVEDADLKPARTLEMSSMLPEVLKSQQKTVDKGEEATLSQSSSKLQCKVEDADLKPARAVDEGEEAASLRLEAIALSLAESATKSASKNTPLAAGLLRAAASVAEELAMRQGSDAKLNPRPIMVEKLVDVALAAAKDGHPSAVGLITAAAFAVVALAQASK